MPGKTVGELMEEMRIIAMFAAAIITSAISAFVGCKMLKKQFEKAGITA